MRFHVPGLPHTITNKTYCHCAFTQKVYKLCEMLHVLGHEVFHYGCEGSNPVCTEHINVITDEFRKKFYPDEWHEKQWDYDVHDKCHKVFFDKTIEEIKTRTSDNDFLLCSWGWGHQPIAAALANSMIVVESGIGYKDTFCNFRVFESYNWMSYVYGRGQIDPKTGQRISQENGRFFDSVIPNYFDPKDFDYTPDKKEDYFLYLGRVVKRKGIYVAIDVITRIGGHLKVAGQGKLNPIPQQRGEIIEHIGFADVERRRELLAKAKAVIMPTIYIEPFGGVAIEAMMSGTPVISTDWGVFNETVLHGITGYRCRTLEQFEWACRNIENISPATCRTWALENFTMDRVAKMYQEYFELLSYTREKVGWYKTNLNRNEMHWLDKEYPKTSPVSTSIPRPEISQKGVVIQPVENEPDYALDLNWYTKSRIPGISFLMRAKNEESTIGMALDSLAQLAIPYEINLVLNNCEDDTEKIAKDRIDKGYPIKLYHYPFQLGKTGVENQCTPVNSVHSTIWLLNWMLFKANYEYTFRWDADFIMTSALVKDIENKVIHEAQADIYNISALFSDSGKANKEPYLWSNSLRPRYCRYSLWHLTKFGVQNPRVASLKGAIIHDSPLSEVKSYWQTEPWWELESREETKDMVNSCKEKYEKFLKIIGDTSTRGRASCPESEELAKKIQQAFGGTDVEEIPLLKEHTSNI